MTTTQKTYTSGGNNQTNTGATMGNHHKVDKSQSFIDEGMTLITETDSDKYLDMASKRNRNKRKEELYPNPDSEMGKFVERWSQ